MTARDLENARRAIAEAEDRIQQVRSAVRQTGILAEMADTLQQFAALVATAIDSCGGIRKPQRPAYA